MKWEVLKIFFEVTERLRIVLHVKKSIFSRCYLLNGNQRGTNINFHWNYWDGSLFVIILELTFWFANDYGTFFRYYIYFYIYLSRTTISTVGPIAKKYCMYFSIRMAIWIAWEHYWTWNEWICNWNIWYLFK